MDILKDVRHVFFTGIGGVGMSGIAEILLDKGYRVSGSDRQLSDLTSYLQTKGAKIFEDHAAKNLQDVDLLVYSSAIPEHNPERQQADLLKIKQIRRAEMLAVIMKDKFNIAIAGTHGKTTTTALCAQILIECGVDPTVVIGGKYKNLQTNARLGSGKVFVTEADEYDRSFLALSPSISVLTTIEEDHLDCYADMNDIKRTFIQFANKTSSSGYIICCIDNPGVRQVIPELTGSVITYGTDNKADFQALNIRYSESNTFFDINNSGSVIENLAIQIPGLHNVLNSLAAYIIGTLLDISSEPIKEALYQFSGVDRRFEVKGIVNDIMLIDDYAHHPTEVAATLESAKGGWDKNIIVVFQPHLFSRTRDFSKQFAVSLAKADEIILSDIYPAREEPIPGVTSELILNDARKLQYHHFQYIPGKEKIVRYLDQHLKPGDMLITMGAGDIWTLADDLIQKLNNNYN